LDYPLEDNAFLYFQEKCQKIKIKTNIMETYSNFQLSSIGILVFKESTTKMKATLLSKYEMINLEDIY
jgi:hypothetical protein